MSECKNDPRIHCGCDDGRNCPVVAERVEWHLDEAAAGLLHAMTGGDEDPTPVTLFVGYSRDDDGKLVYGLHAYESEYPEEGVTPLLEFAAPSTPAKGAA